MKKVLKGHLTANKFAIRFEGPLKVVEAHDNAINQVIERVPHKLYSCNICAQSFPTGQHLKAHTNDQHVTPVVSCELCNSMFTQMFYLNQIYLYFFNLCGL